MITIYRLFTIFILLTVALHGEDESYPYRYLRSSDSLREVVCISDKLAIIKQTTGGEAGSFVVRYSLIRYKELMDEQGDSPSALPIEIEKYLIEKVEKISVAEPLTIYGSLPIPEADSVTSFDEIAKLQRRNRADYFRIDVAQAEVSRVSASGYFQPIPSWFRRNVESIIRGDVENLPERK